MFKRFLALWLTLALILPIFPAPSLLQAQTGGLAPALPPSFLNASGVIAAGDLLCTTATGSNTPLATYQDSLLTTPLPNPITLNALGTPQTGGGSSTSIYIQGANYRFALYAPGTGNTCNGAQVGTQIWQRDNVYDLFELCSASGQTCTFAGNVAIAGSFGALLDDFTCHASKVTGSSPNDWGGKVQACIALLSTSGGIVDATGLTGPQTISASITASVPVWIKVGPSQILCTITSSAGCINTAGAGSAITGLGPSSSIIQVSNTTGYGINLGGNGSRIEHLTLRGDCAINCAVGSSGIGINSGNTAMAKVNDVIVEKWNDIGLNTGGGASAWTITNSTFQDIYGDAVFLASGSGHTVDSLSITRVGSNGVDINASNSTIRNINCYEVGAINASIDSNCIVDSGIQGNADDNDISGIHGTAITGATVRLRGDNGGSVSRVHVHHSTSNGASAGFYVDVSPGTGCGTTSNNIFDHNVAYNGTSAGNADFGVFGGSGTPCTANGNYFDQNISLSTVEGYGIAVTWGTGNVIVNNMIMGPPATATILNSFPAVNTFICNAQTSYTANPLCPIDTIQPTLGGSAVTLTSAGNTELLFTSSAAGTRKYAFVTDSSGNLNIVDVTGSNTTRLALNSSGNITVPGIVTADAAFGVGTSGVTITAGNGAPGANCTLGSVYLRQDGASSTTLYVCTATNTWSAVTIP